MEDVVLHYQPGSAAGLSSLLETTEKLLESFPRRSPPVFTPWFPAAADRHLPVRPARPAPVITCSSLVPDSGPPPRTAQNHLPEGHGLVAETPRDRRRAETTRTPPEDPQKPKDGDSEPSDRLPPSSLFNKPEGRITGRSPEKHKEVFSVPDSPVKRSWSVFTQRRVLLRSSPSPSKQFQHVVSVHRLHLRQRAKWVIGQHNCRPSPLQVWRSLSRSVRSSGLPSCNANIQRERAEIWVFCDVLHSEQVGRFLKEELQLSGGIGLSVHRLGNIFSM